MTFRQVAENALNTAYNPDCSRKDDGIYLPENARWSRIYDFYEKRYLNPKRSE